MVAEVSGASVRRGARSCAECRRRKARCIWSCERQTGQPWHQSACERCVSRGLTCLPQLVRSLASSNVFRPRSNEDRISQIERKLASLSDNLTDNRDRLLDAHPLADFDNGSPPEAPEDEVEDVCPPHHLRLLFEGDDASTGTPDSKQFNMLSPYIITARNQLQQLIPAKAELDHLADFSSEWMAMYHSLFPAHFTFRTGQHLVTNYEHMREPQVHPVMLAMYLLAVAITIQQLPPESSLRTSIHGRSVAGYVGLVCRTITRVVINNDTLLGTIEGLETAMLLIRLVLGRGSLKSTWLMLRRVISIAELINLPQAQHALQRIKQTGDDGHSDGLDLDVLRRRLAVWEAICATDRNFSMMMNLPPSTLRYKFPTNSSIYEHDHVSSQAYNYQLSTICAMVFEIDECYAYRETEAAAYEKVLSADRRLRELLAAAPQSWWQVDQGGPLADLMVKFWHQYITVRVHLRPAMLNNSAGGQYGYSHSACWNSCRDAVSRFVKFRASIPSGFFVCRMLDVQAFTMAAFMSLSDALPATSLRMKVDPDAKELVDQLIECFQSVLSQPGSDFASQAAATLRKLQTLSTPAGFDHPSQVILDIPLLGRINLSRTKINPTAVNLSTCPDPSNELLGAQNVATPATRDKSASSAPSFAISASEATAEALMSWDLQLTNTPLWTDLVIPFDMPDSMDVQQSLMQPPSWF